MFARFDGRAIHGVHLADAPFTVDKALTATWSQGIGAEIMGRGKFGPQTGAWGDDDWRGWWGDTPPFRTPVFVLTHYAHPDIHFDNGTSFHFIDASPQEALEQATQAAAGLDVRLGGGPSTIREFLAADLVDFMHLVTAPLVLGSGVSLWERLTGVEERFGHSVRRHPQRPGPPVLEPKNHLIRRPWHTRTARRRIPDRASFVVRFFGGSPPIGVPSWSGHRGYPPCRSQCHRRRGDRRGPNPILGSRG